MPLGDSITGSICYRARLWDKLSKGGYTNVDFVGTRSGPGGCQGVTSYDMNNEGHGGYIITDILKAAGTGVRPGGADTSDPYVSDSRDLVTWFDGSQPDIVLMHFGTNDVWNNKAPSDILNAYTAVLNKLRSRNPNVIVLVAQIIPMNPSGCSPCNSRVQALNATIPGWAASHSQGNSPITVVDQYTGFDVSWTVDGVHPNATTGSQAMADKWYAALTPLLK
jgi:lysophospholipase L1-like esterase